jgi:MFS family permease
MLIGGILWGLIGDRLGRKGVLFGSIACYSISNLANAFITSTTQYAVLRFVAGIGLAGELGAGTTLAVESLPPRLRGYGTTLIATVGVLGAVAAALVAGFVPWRYAYAIGGALGLALLLARIGVHESDLFTTMGNEHRSTRKALGLLLCPKRLWRILCCVLIGVPTWFAIGVLITFAPELSITMGIESGVQARQAVLYTYLGLTAGDVLSGLLSQALQSRKKVMVLFICLGAVASGAYLFLVETASQLYLCASLIGVCMGYWAVLVTSSAEQFGTNLRATVATSVPNFIRAAVIPLSFAVLYLKSDLGFSLRESAAIVGSACFGLAILGLSQIRETFGVSVDFIEE